MTVEGLLNTTAAKWAVIVGVGAAAVYLIGRSALPKASEAIKESVEEAASKVGQAINPINHDNIFNQGFNAITGAVLAPEKKPDEFSFGVWLWEKLNPDKVAMEQALIESWNQATKP